MSSNLLSTCISLAAILIVSTAEGGDPIDPTTPYEERSIVYSGGDYKAHTFRYRLLVPPDYDPKAKDPGKRWPLILFLHGAGERGDDNKAQLKYFPTDMATQENRKRYPAFIIAPQCPRGRSWSAPSLREVNRKFQPEPTHEVRVVLAILDALLKELPVDRDRLYLTGLSMGGYGSWDLAARCPDRWAAVVPICGGGDPESAPIIKDIPIWVFHGAKDRTVPPERSRSMVEAIKKAGGKPRYIEFPDAGHDSWTPGYRHPEFLPWLFRQKRPPAGQKPDTAGGTRGPPAESGR